MIGRVLAALHEANMADDTLVVFTSDNGPWLVKGPDGGSALPLRGGKGSTWEGGMREPTIAWWPGHVPAGEVCRELGTTMDIFPTSVALAGGETVSGSHLLVATGDRRPVAGPGRKHGRDGLGAGDLRDRPMEVARSASREHPARVLGAQARRHFAERHLHP